MRVASTCGKSARFKEKGMFSARCFFRPRVEQKVATVAKGTSPIWQVSFGVRFTPSCECLLVWKVSLIIPTARTF